MIKFLQYHCTSTHYRIIYIYFVYIWFDLITDLPALPLWSTFRPLSTVLFDPHRPSLLFPVVWWAVVTSTEKPPLPCFPSVEPFLRTAERKPRVWDLTPAGEPWKPQCLWSERPQTHTPLCVNWCSGLRSHISQCSVSIQDVVRFEELSRWPWRSVLTSSLRVCSQTPLHWMKLFDDSQILAVTVLWSAGLRVCAITVADGQKAFGRGLLLH